MIEVEGEKDFVEAQLDKLMPLIQACGFGTRSAAVQLPEPESEVAEHAEAAHSDNGTAAGKNGANKSKRNVNRPPKGHSCADRITVLKEDGFFKSQKTPAEIVEALAKKGWTHNGNQVSAAAGKMFNRGDIQRTKAGKGFAYFWDRD